MRTVIYNDWFVFRSVDFCKNETQPTNLKRSKKLKLLNWSQVHTSHFHSWFSIRALPISLHGCCTQLEHLVFIMAWFFIIAINYMLLLIDICVCVSIYIYSFFFIKTHFPNLKLSTHTCLIYQVDVIESQWNVLQSHIQNSHDFTELEGFHQE